MFRTLAPLKSENGITLIELLIYGVFVLLIFIGAYTIFEASDAIYVSASSQAEAQRAGRIAQASITKHLRMAESFATAGDYAVDIRADINDDNLWDEIQYYLEDGCLYRRISGGQQELIISGIRNHIIGKPIFTYYDLHDDLITDQDSRITKTHQVKIDLTIDTEPNRPPDAYTLTSKVTLRNK